MDRHDADREQVGRRVLPPRPSTLVYVSSIMRLRRIAPGLALVPLSCVLVVSGIAAQDAPAIPLGVRVRVQGSPPRREATTGTLLGLTRDSVLLATGDPNVRRAFALASLSEVAVSRGRHSRTGRGALIGLISGTVAGVASGLILCVHADCESSGGDFAGLAAATLGLGGALVGTGLGALIGSFIHTERWESMPLGHLRLGVGPPGSLRIGVVLGPG